jgi:hypothetical protein
LLLLMPEMELDAPDHLLHLLIAIQVPIEHIDTLPQRVPTAGPCPCETDILQEVNVRVYE